MSKLTVNGRENPTSFTKAELLALKEDPLCDWEVRDSQLELLDMDFKVNLNNIGEATPGDDGDLFGLTYVADVADLHIHFTLIDLENGRYVASMTLSDRLDDTGPTLKLCK